MVNNYDQIATVTIEIIAAVADPNSYGNILIIGPLPAAGTTNAPGKCASYSSIEYVKEAGWVTEGDDADPVGVAAALAFSQSPPPSEIYIAPIQEGGDGTAEYAVETLERATATDGWYVVCPVGIEDDEVIQLAAYVENLEKMMVYTETGFFGAGEDGDDVPTVGTACNRTAAVYAKESSSQSDEDMPAVNAYMNVAFSVAWLAYEAGSETSAFKALAGVYPAELTGTEQRALKDGCVNYVSTVGSKYVTMVGKVLSGEWCDIIRFRDWLKNDMQKRVVKLFLANPKVPYTDGGITLIQNAMEASLQAGQAAGGIDDSIYDEDGEEMPGYKVSVPKASGISDTEKASRILTGCKFTARLTGAIHFVEITGALAYSI